MNRSDFRHLIIVSAAISQFVVELHNAHFDTEPERAPQETRLSLTTTSGTSTSTFMGTK
jgi:hypothetical protein